MSTHSTIAVQHADGSVSQCYCHWDGYLSHVGKMLANHYNTIEQAENLVSLGYISSLYCHNIPTGPHSYDNPEDGVTVYYGRDRGEEDVDSNVFSNFADFEENGMSEEFNYLFKDGKWECRQQRHSHDDFIPNVATWLSHE